MRKSGTFRRLTDSDATLTAQPSGKTLKVYVIAANDAGQAAPKRHGDNRRAVSVAVRA
jgi:hypothetical protein